MQGFFDLTLSDPDGSIVWTRRFSNIITDNGIDTLGEQFLVTGSIASNRLFLSDDNRASSADLFTSRWTHSTGTTINTSVTANSTIALRYKAYHALSSPPLTTVQVPGPWGKIGIQDAVDSAICVRDITGTMTSPARQIKYFNYADAVSAGHTIPGPYLGDPNAGGGYGSIVTSGTYIPSTTGSGALELSHHYPHMDLGVLITDGSNTDNDIGSSGVSYIYWTAPHQWQIYIDPQTHSYITSVADVVREGDKFQTSSTSTAQFYVPGGISSTAYLAEDKPTSPVYASGYLYVTYIANTGPTGRAVRWIPSRGIFEDIRDSAATANFTACVCDASGALWAIPTSGSTVRVFNPVTSTWASKPFGPDSDLYGVAHKRIDDTVWAINSNASRVYKFDHQSPSGVPYVLPPLNASTTMTAGRRNMDFDSVNTLWYVGNTGAFAADTTTPIPGTQLPTRKISTASGLASNNLREVYVDHTDTPFITYNTTADQFATVIQKSGNTGDLVVNFTTASGVPNTGSTIYQGVCGDRARKMVSFIGLTGSPVSHLQRVMHYYEKRRAKAVGTLLQPIIDEPDYGEGGSVSFSSAANVVSIGGFLYWFDGGGGGIFFRRHPIKTYYGWNEPSQTWGIFDEGVDNNNIQRVAASGYHHLQQGVHVAFVDDATPGNTPDFVQGFNYLLINADGIAKQANQTLALTYGFYVANARFDLQDPSGVIPSNPGPYERTLTAAASGGFLAVDVDSTNGELATLTISGSTGVLQASSGVVASAGAGAYWVEPQTGKIVFNSADAAKPFQAVAYTWLRRD